MDVRFVGLNGEPLIAIVETEEAVPYRRRGMGFLPPSERNEHVPSTGGSVVGPLICSCDEEPDEPFIMEIYETEEEEGRACV